MKMMLTFGSLFSGIGGIDLGLERAGLICKWQCEIDDYATRVLQKHWPDVPRFRDVRKCGAHNLGAVDLIAGGFPCQDISNAGKRTGIDGDRSGLWREYHRIICELRPRYVLVENVAALLVRGMGRVLRDLAASGYDAEWQCIPAAAVGAPHIRDRVFILAYTQIPGERELSGKRRSGLVDFNGRGSSIPDTDRHEQDRRGGTMQVGWFGSTGALAADHKRNRDQWGTEPDVGRVAHGIPSRVDRLRGLGNAVVPQVAEYIGRSIIQHAS